MLEYFYKVIKISPYSNGVEHPTVSKCNCSNLIFEIISMYSFNFSLEVLVASSKQISTPFYLSLIYPSSL